MDHKTVVDLFTIPLFTGVVGYLTNWTGVVMLFAPLRFHGVRLPGLRLLFPYLPRRVQVLPLISHDGRFGWQGILPSRADKMASIAVDKGLAKLGNISDFYRELEPDLIAEHLAKIAQHEIRDIVEQIMMRENPQLWRDVPPVVKEAVFVRVRRQLPRIVRKITEEIGDNIDQLIDAKLMVIKYLSARPELLNELFLVMGRRELRFMKNFGFYLGVPLGVALWAILQVFPNWYVLPIGGMIIGWTVNWLGIELIFEPARPSKWVPWRQGLLVKRQAEVTQAYARLVADNVITLRNIGDELMTGSRSDRTRQLLEDALHPAVDDALGPARTAVRAVIGSQEYEQISAAVASEASGLAPIAFQDAEFGERQSGRIYRFIADQMNRMSPEDFVQMLRSAIKQDEWLLFLHGGVLGLFAGLLHLLLFGV